MARVYTYTKTSTMEPENIEEIDGSLTPPTREEVTTQLKKHFAEHDQDEVTDEDIKNLTETICRKFDELKNQPYGSFAKYNPQKPYLSIKMYPNEWMLSDREAYPRDYSPITIIPVFGSKILFTVTVVTYLKWISLAYVSKECKF